MSDIDFEELDKAVNSLMNQHDQDQTQPKDASAGISSKNESQSTPQRSQMTQNEPSVSRDTPAPIISRRSSGRFMDVVPASAGRPAPVRETSADTRPSRHSGTLQPLVNTQDTQIADNQQKVNSDAASFDAEIADLTALEKELSQSPMESPFLSDIEVDKRPLGNSAQEDSSPDSTDENLESQTESQVNTTPVEDPVLDPIANWQSLQEGKIPTVESELESNSSNNSDDPWSSEPVIETNTEMPEYTRPELSADVVALESIEIENSSVDPASSNESVNPTSLDQKNADLTQLKQDLSVAETPKQPSDITPQYKPSDVGAPEPSAIFDAASEDPLPLAHPEKKRSGWMVLVWIIGLLLVGVIGGVLVWNFLIK